MQILTGTSGYSYKEWKGPFYPEDLPASKFLEYYATRLPAVEINNTFYRMPRPEVLGKWADQTGTDFRFVLKASRRITHFKRLKEVEEQTMYLLQTASELGERLGAVFFQLPPNFKQDIERLNTFLDFLPDPSRVAFEFRHESWFDEATYDCLRTHGTALCVADTEEKDGELVKTGSWGYMRLRKPGYSEAALEDWAARIADQGWEHAYVFFKHEDAGAGPKLAERFLQMVS
ncbi:MAG: DUF72 domain-containing protein [Gemmatimonadota bacterium]